MTIEEMLNLKINRQQEILNKAKQENLRSLDEKEQKEFDSLQREIDLLKEIKEEPGGAQSTQNRTVEDERNRTIEITTLCREFNLDPDKLIKDGTPVDEVRAAILKNLKREGEPISTRAAVSVTQSEQDRYRAAASDALLIRAGVAPVQPSEGATDFRNIGIKELAIDCLTREGENELELRRMAPDDLLTKLSRSYFNPTAAFPAILDTAINKHIVKVYEEVPTTFQEWTTKGSLSDFKESKDNLYVIGGAGSFLKVPENGELKSSTPKTDKLPNRKLDTYGTSFSMSRQAFINDDIGFITEMPGVYAISAKQTIDEQVYKLLYDNGKIYDGKSLFSADHNNLITTGTAPTQTSIQSIILKMQKQKNQFDKPITMIPGWVVVPIGYEFVLSVIFGSTQVTGSANNDKNPLYNYPVKTIQSPVLNGLAGSNPCPWFLVSNHTSAQSIQVDYLNGQEVPTIIRREAAGQLGFVWDIYLDWGIAVRDFRGITKNPGVAMEE